jgi:hypothetical protein
MKIIYLLYFDIILIIILIYFYIEIKNYHYFYKRFSFAPVKILFDDEVDRQKNILDNVINIIKIRN